MKRLSIKNLLSTLLALTICATPIHAITLSKINSTLQTTLESCLAALRRLNGAEPPKVIIETSGTLGTGNNVSNNASFAIQITHIRTPEKEIELHSLEPLALSDDTKIHLFVTDIEGNRKRVILPPEMDSRLIAYLKAGAAPSSPFDCNCFAHYMNGKTYVFGTFNNSEWQVEELSSERNLVPGNTILIGHNRANITHLAIFLRGGFYLSKFGGTGPLIITTLDEMKKGFGGDLVFVAKPT
jgi:hypothetical protein